jgi:REP element-mobilizing transposase RayT
MPRGARLDAPGTLHHAIVRGIERGAIFQDDRDRAEFVRRLKDLAKVTGTSFYAFALMTNHVHLLLKSGATGLSTFMRRLLSGYAQYYNRRHQRVGHLFQNRYRSIICEEETYFTQLLAYIHLNPLRAGIVSSLEGLASYPWGGHSVLMGRQVCDWLDRDYSLQFFGSREGSAKNEYLKFLASEMKIDREQELTGGGLVRSHGGWSNVLSMRKQGLKELGDERILGSGEFVQSILDQAENSFKRQMSGSERIEMMRKEIETVCQRSGCTAEMLRSGGRRSPLPELRKEIARKFVEESGVSLAETARQIGVTTSAVCAMLRR